MGWIGGLDSFGVAQAQAGVLRGAVCVCECLCIDEKQNQNHNQQG